MFQKNIFIFFIVLFFLIIFLGIFENNEVFSGYTTQTEKEFLNDTSFHYSENSIFSWPVFGYYTISSKFGYRISPTTGASSYHSGVDIPAPEKTNIYSISDRNRYFCWFLRRRWLFYNCSNWRFSNNLWTCFSWFYCL